MEQLENNIKHFKDNESDNKENHRKCLCSNQSENV